jgi:exodeoxyribonuclease VII small subunit
MEVSENQASPSSENGSPCPPNFEQALEQLQQIVHQLEEGEIGLAEALDHYEMGIRLLKQCYGLLERAERRIELLSGVDAAGNPITEPFADDPSMSLDEKSQNRGRRRTKAGAKAVPAEIIETAESPQVRMDEAGGLF